MPPVGALSSVTNHLPATENVPEEIKAHYLLPPPPQKTPHRTAVAQGDCNDIHY